MFLLNTLALLGSGQSTPVAPAWVLRSGATPATLDVDFTENLARNAGVDVTIASLLTCARASSGLYENVDGTLTSFGSNALRRGTSGLLVEGLATNLCLYSQLLTNAAWTPVGSTVASNATICPDGSALCQKITEDTSTGMHGVEPTAGLANASGVHTLSAYVRGSNADAITAGIFDGTVYQSAIFSLTGSGVGFQTSGVINSDMRMLSGPTGWWRLTLTVAASAATKFYIASGRQNLAFASDGRPSFAGNAAIGLFVWGVQFESGAAASSYIPATSAPATRAADIVTFTDTSWLSGAGDSLYAEHALTGKDTGYGRRGHSNGVVLAIDGTNNVELREALGSAPLTPAPLYTSIGTSLAGATCENPLPDAPWFVRSAARLSVNNCGVCLNGGTVATDTSEAEPGAVTAVRLGCDLAGANPLNSYIRRISAFRGVALSNAALAALDAPWIGTDIAGLSTKATTGSIASGSNQITVADVAGFVVGQKVIVAVGGEPGAGLRGTMGVGGVWPTLSYANTAARDADTSQAAGRYAWLRDTGDVTYWTGVTWALSTYYYYDKALPRALIAAINGISGNVLTLSVNASEAATAAEVSVDNFAALTSGFSALAKAQIPAGNYAISESIVLARPSMDIRGRSKNLTEIRVPKGISLSGINGQPAALLMSYSRNAHVSDFTLRGNAGLNGYGLGLIGDFVVTTTVGPLMVCGTSPDAAFKRLRLIDSVAQALLATGGCHNTWAYDIEVIQNSQQQEYAQWQVQWVQTLGGGLINCSYDSDYFIPAFERFSSYGGGMYGITSRNGIIATNASAGFTLRDISVTMEENCLRRNFPGSLAMIGCNSNTGGGVFLDGAFFENIALVAEGELDTSGVYASGAQLHMMPQGIIFSAEFSVVEINGGSFDSPGYDAGTGIGTSQAIVCNTNPPIVYVDNFHCTGVGGPPYNANITIHTGRATGCTGTINITNPV